MTQNIVTHDKVIDASSKNSLPNVQVDIEGTSLFAFTDGEGMFKIYVSDKT